MADPLFEQVVCLLDTTTSLDDLSSHGITITADGGTVVNTGSGYLPFDGVNDAIYAFDTAAFGTEDFCVEMSMQVRSVTGVQEIWTSDLGDGPPALRLFQDASTLKLESDGTLVASTAVSNLTFYQVAFAREAGTLRLFVGSSQIGSDYADATNYPNDGFRMGSTGAGANWWTGRLEGLRITRGAARWTAAHTPDSVPYPTYLATLQGQVLDDTETPVSWKVFAFDTVTGEQLFFNFPDFDLYYRINVKTNNEVAIVGLNPEYPPDPVLNHKVIRVIPLGAP